MAFALAGGGCERGSQDMDAGASAASSASAPAEGAAPGARAKPLVEQRDDGSLAWIVLADGTVRLTVRGTDDKIIPPPDVEASLTARGATSNLWADGESLVGAIGTLEDELTDVTYTVRVKGKPWTGLLQLPSAGTEALAAEPTVTVAPGMRGPNGGLVEVVGDQRVELVADPESGELRAYLLDDKLQVMPVGDAELTIGIVE